MPTIDPSPWFGLRVTITTRRGSPSWLGDDVGLLTGYDPDNPRRVLMRNAGLTMGRRTTSAISVASITAIRAARPGDRAGIHNDKGASS